MSKSFVDIEPLTSKVQAIHDMNWKEITLGQVIHVKHGYAFKSQFFADNGNFIVLTPGNFHEIGGFRLRPGKDRYYQSSFPEEYLLDEGQVVIAMTEQGEGLLGSSAYIPESNKYLHNQRLGLVCEKEPNTIDKKFIYYLFNTKIVRGQIRGSASGTKVKHTAPERIYKVKVKIPGLHSQQKIASILSAYDDLIENNRRRIGLLEQSARLLYQEWFVRFRFPGHEHVRMVDGLPEGWEKTYLGNALNLQRGFDLPSSQRKPGSIPIYASTGVTGYHSVAKVKGPGIVTGRSGSLGQVQYIAGDYWPLNTTLWVTDFMKVSPIFSYFLLLDLKLEKYNGGAAVPTLNRNDVHKIEIALPPPKLIDEFSEYALSMYCQIQKLQEVNQKLKEARDILLPRLMNGEIVV